MSPTTIISTGGKSGKGGFAPAATVDTNDKVKASSTDSTTDYLANKLEAGSGISLLTTSGLYETVRITNSAMETYTVKNRSADTLPDYLENKIIPGTGISFSNNFITEQITISSNGLVTVRSPGTPDYLTNRLAVSTGLSKTEADNLLTLTNTLPETYTVKNRSADTLPDYLENKIIPGTGISFSNNFITEQITISSNGLVTVRSPGTPDYLTNRIAVSTGLSKTEADNLLTLTNTLPETYKVMASSTDATPNYLYNRLTGDTVGVVISSPTGNNSVSVKIGGFTDDRVALGTSTGALESSGNVYNTSIGLGVGRTPTTPLDVYKNVNEGTDAIAQFINAGMGDSTWISYAIGKDNATLNKAALFGFWNSTTSTANKVYFGHSGKDIAAGGEGLVIQSNSSIWTTFKLGVGVSTISANYQLELPNSSTQKARAYAWDTYSDSRIKTEVEELSYGLAEILRLVPKSYFQHDTPCDKKLEDSLTIKTEGKRTIGLFAQDVNEIIPEAVQAGDEKSLWSIDYMKIIPVMVKAIQELNGRIVALENK